MTGEAGHAERSANLSAILEEENLRPRARLREWISRYGLAECGGIVCALVASAVARHATGSAIAAAYAGAWGETAGYAGVIIIRDVAAESRATREPVGAKEARGKGALLVDLVAEFGPSGVLDTLIVRPLAMGIGVRLLAPTRGLLAGKLAADVIFYIPVIWMYERRKLARRRRPRANG